LPQAQKLIATVLPLASIDTKEALKIVRYHTKRNFIAYRSHRKRHLMQAEIILSNMSL
jgi:hypothetical protein